MHIGPRLKGDKVLYVFGRVNGIRISKSLGTTVMSEARARAKLIVEAARDGKWAQVKDDLAMRKDRLPATFHELFAAYREAAKIREAATGKPRPRTVQNYILAMQGIVKAANGDAFEGSWPITRFNRETMQAYLDMLLARSTTPDETLRARARETAYSAARNAKSLASTWAMEYYRGKKIHVPPEWVQDVIGYTPVTKPRRKYRYPADLAEKTIAAGSELRTQRADLWPAWVLCYHLGMRAGEAAAARWDWIEEHNGRQYMVIRVREDWRPKSRDHQVPIGAGLWENMQAFRRADDPWILPGGNPTARRNLIERDLAAWIRGLGWDRPRFPKAAHELRKLAGARWYTDYGLQWAAEWLGDNPDVVFKYYADVARHPQVEQVM
jgi:integrase